MSEQIIREYRRRAMLLSDSQGLLIMAMEDLMTRAGFIPLSRESGVMVTFILRRLNRLMERLTTRQALSLGELFEVNAELEALEALRDHHHCLLVRHHVDKEYAKAVSTLNRLDLAFVSNQMVALDVEINSNSFRIWPS